MIQRPVETYRQPISDWRSRPSSTQRWSREARAMQFEIEFRAIEQERRRVAKELHDEILPTLARLIRSIQTQDTDGQHRELVERLHILVEAFRDLLGELHPVDLEELGLVPSLHNICSRYARLSGLCVMFIERAEECSLSELQQLCLHRAIQAALRMFVESDNDILLVSYEKSAGMNVITARCVDKRVSSAEWLSVEKQGFDAFESWCQMAGAKVEIGANKTAEFPCDLVITVPDTPEVLEVDELLERAQNGYAKLLKQDKPLFANLAVEAERKRIFEDINRLIFPELRTIIAIADECENNLISLEVGERMHLMAAGIAGVMSDIHPRLLAQSGLVPSIKALVDRFRRASFIETKIKSDSQCDYVDISLDAKFAIYRVTQEALNNIEKHSGATQASVILKLTETTLSVQIEDNGKGFQEQRSTQSRGLKIIRERAAAVAAEVGWEKSTSFATGTLLTISLDCSLTAS